MQLVVNTLSLSSFYISFSLGLTLIFGVLRIVNYAHGEIYMLGGYTLYFASLALAAFVPGPAVMVLAILFAAVVGALAGYILQGAIFRPLRDKSFSIFMATVGISYMVQSTIMLSVGATGRSISPVFPGFISVFGGIIPNQRLFVFVMMMIMVGGLYAFLMHSKQGRNIRAAAMNQRGARLQGINLERVNVTAAVIGAAMASVSGTLMASVVSINPFMGAEAIWRAFIIIIVGGIGSIPGTIVAAVLFAALDTTLIYTGFGKLSSLADAIIMLLVLASRPQGILGVRD